MLIRSDKLIGKPVITQSGEHLGKVLELYINTDTQEIEQYEVQSSIVKSLFGKKLLIHRRQVIDITEKAVVVEDGLIEENKLQPALDT